MLLGLGRKLNDISISKKLYFTIGFTALLITIELCTLWFSITTLSAVRSYVGGEGLWSKAQKDAILNLRSYAYSRDNKDYEEFKRWLEVPLGDKFARVVISRPELNMEAARGGFLAGRNHPDDIDGMIHLARRFHKVYYLDKAFKAWAKAEPALDTLRIIGAKLHEMIVNNAGEAETAAVLKDIDHINKELTKLEDDFSFTLGEGARWLEGMVLKVVLALSLTIGISSMLIAISINRNLKRGLDAIAEGADKIRRGELKIRVPVYSKDEVGVLATSFNEMIATLDHNMDELKLIELNLITEKERAEQSEKAKQQFLINMSHEIRTPMNAVLGFARHLEDSSLNEDQAESLKMIIKSGEHLLATFNDILDFSRIGVGDIKFITEPFGIRETVASVFMLNEPNARTKNISFRYDVDKNVPDQVYGDQVRLSQILLNLTSNAIKFTNNGGVVINVSEVRGDAKRVWIEFTVRDSGIGIPLEKQEKIFDVFEQAENDTSRKFGGTGLGLSIVKQLVILQDGQISVSSIPGEGAEFRFTMPFIKPEKPGIAKKEMSESLFAGADSQLGLGTRVLIVEDNAINQMLVLKLLNKHGYQTCVAENGKIAMEVYTQNEFDIILMDLQMPEMDGYETTVHIREMIGEKGDIPIVAMTAHTIKGELERCMAIGMNDYISKPFHANELYEKINKLVNQS